MENFDIGIPLIPATYAGIKNYRHLRIANFKLYTSLCLIDGIKQYYGLEMPGSSKLL